MKSRYATVLLVTLAVCTMLPRATAQDVMKVAIAPPSYSKPVLRADLLEDQELREALILACRLRGLLVASDAALPFHSVEYTSFPPARFNSLEFDYAILIHREETIIVSIYDYWLDQIWEGRLSEQEDAASAILNLAAEAVDAILEYSSEDEFPEKAGATPDFPLQIRGVFDPGAVSDSTPLDLDFSSRVGEINKQLETLQSGKAEANAIATLSRLFALHGAYPSRVDEWTTLKYFGKATLFADLMHRALPDDPSVTQFSNEIHSLANRFACGQWPYASQDEFLLPESQMLVDYMNRPLGEFDEQASASVLFELLVHTEHLLYLRNWDDKVITFLYQPDKTLSSSFESTYIGFKQPAGAFGVCQFWNDVEEALMSEAGNTAAPLEVLTLAIAESEEVKDMVQSVLNETQMALGGNPWEVLDNTGAKAKTQDDAINDAEVYSFGILKRLTENIRGNDELLWSNELRLSLSDLLDEFVQRHLFLLRARRERYSLVGWGDWVERIDLVRARFGLQNDRCLSHFDGPSTISDADIIQWTALVNQLGQELNSSAPSPAKRLFRGADEQLRDTVLAGSGEEISQSLRQDIVTLINRALDDPDFYDKESFFAVELGASLNDEMGAITSATPARDVQRLNRSLLEATYKRVFVSEDLRNPLLSYALVEQAGLEQRATQRFTAGDFQDAIQAVMPIKSKLSRTSTITGLLFEGLLRTGNIEEALATKAEIRDVSFQREETRYDILRWRAQDFSGFEHMMDVEGTNSARDYTGRAEYAFRMGDFVSMENTAQAFHYSGSARIGLMTALARLLQSKSDDSVQWDNLRGLFAQDIRTLALQGGLNFYDHWLVILDQEFRDNPEWIKTKGVLPIEAVATVEACAKTLINAPDETKLLATHNTLRALTKTHIDNGGLPDENWFLRALEEEHESVGRYLLLQLDEVNEGGLPAELESLIADLLEKSARVEQSEGFAARGYPFPMRFVLCMLRFGGDPGEVARFAASIPELENYLVYSDPLFASAAGYPETLEAILDNPSNREPDWNLEIVISPRVDPERIFDAALAANVLEVAYDCAIQVALDTDQFDLLARLFTTENDAIAWVQRNAPTRKLEDSWSEDAREHFAEKGPDAENSPDPGARELQVPDLYVYLTRTKDAKRAAEI